MKKKEQNSILSYYTSLYEKFGFNTASIGWPNGKQSIRFRVATEIGDLKNSKILDIGNGFGDFPLYLSKKKFKIRDYLGVDINPIFVKIAKQRNPKYRFQIRDVEKKKLKEKFDWVFAIGVTNQAGSYNYVEGLMKEMLRISTKGIMMDFLSSYVDFKRGKTFHVSPERIFKIAKRFSKRIVIRHDYLPYQFSVYVYKKDKLTKEKTFENFKI